jgi:hypothetical protein
MPPTGPEKSRAPFAVALVALAAVLLASGASARAALQQIARVLSLDGKPEPASANVLSAHQLEALDSMPAQAQAEFLLERAVNHYEGANRQIEVRLPAGVATLSLATGSKISSGRRLTQMISVSALPQSRSTSWRASWRKTSKQSIVSSRSRAAASRTASQRAMGSRAHRRTRRRTGADCRDHSLLGAR